MNSLVPVGPVCTVFYPQIYLIRLSNNRDAEKVDGVHVQGDRDDVQAQGGVRHTGDRTCSG